MPLFGFDELRAAADAAKPRHAVAVAGAANATVLIALSQAHARGWVEPTLVGEASAIRATAAAAHVDVSQFQIVDSTETGLAAVDEVRSGRAQLLMKGQIDTPALMRAVLQSEAGLRTGRAAAR